MIRPIILAAALCAMAIPAFAGEPIAPPPGWVRFCTNNPSFCDRHDPVSVPASALAAIGTVNHQVNDGILPEKLDTPEQRSDETRDWRVVMNGGLGACVEYSLSKELILSYLGIPPGAMRLAVVHRAQDAPTMNHMVLLVRVAGTDMVLDSLTPAIWRVDQEQWDSIIEQDNTGPNGLAWVKP